VQQSRVSGERSENRKAKPHLLGDELVGLVEESAALRVTENDPRELDVLELLKPVVKEKGRGQRNGSTLPKTTKTHEISPV